MAWIEVCRECKKPFSITGDKTGPFLDREDIDCPHCKANWGSRRTAGVYRTFALTSEEEAEYRKQNP